MAYKLGAGLVIIRKPGKLPSKVERIEYELEYGTDSLEIHQDAVEPGKEFWLSTICLLPEEQFAQPANLSKNRRHSCRYRFLIELDNLKGKTHLPKSAKNIALLHY